MKKIKKFYNEHRVFTILMAIAIVCAILIVKVLIECFYVKNGSSKYGNRLEDIKTVEITKDIRNEVESKIIENTSVSSAKVEVTGKIVYIKIVFNPATNLVDAESVAQKSLEYFAEEELSLYDFHFTLTCDKSEKDPGFIIEGAKNKKGSGLVWNNNNPIEEPTESEE